MMGSIQHVAITGATGFVGSAITRKMVQAGLEVTVLLRPESNLARLAGIDGLHLLQYRQLNEPAVSSWLRTRGVHAMVHCAWRGVAGQDRNEIFQVTENLPLTLQAAQVAVESGLRRWIGIGSHAEYGNPNCVVSESHPSVPTTLYGKAKLAAGIASLGLCEAQGIPAAWVRIFSTYGPGDSGAWLIRYVIDEFLAGRRPKLTRCEQIWDYLYVDDAARAVLALLEAPATGVFNLGSGRPVVLRSVIEAIRQELKTELTAEFGAVPYRPDQVMHLEADISKLSGATGWHPQVDLAEGLRLTVAAARTSERC
jgi:UDP-glucose 4-epimerase